MYRSWLTEPRYRAVREAIDGSPVTEVTLRYGVSRQAVYSWKRRYEAEGVAGLVEKSRRPHRSPSRLDAEVEALVCELRRAHPRWVPVGCATSSACGAWIRCRPG